MEVTYRKNLNKSYMCVDTQEQVLERYELLMLEHCRIPELLNVCVSASDKNSRYLYDISGRQQIADYLSGQKLGCSHLQKLLFSIQNVCVSLSEYLLRESGICLDLEFIYINLENGSFQFTYLPFYEKNLPEAFRSCMEQLLRKIDHQDQKAVELGYKIYQLCIEDNVNIRKLLESVLSEKQPVRDEDKMKEEGNQEEKVHTSSKTEENREQENQYSQPQPAQEKKLGNWREKLSEVFEMIGNYIPKSFEIADSFLKSCKKDEQLSKTKKKIRQKEKMWFHKKKIMGQSEQFFQEITIQEEVPEVHPTEILAIQENNLIGKLEYQGNHQCEDIIIEGESFLLGKNCEQVDGVILAEGVSRLHARIIRQEERYFIEDLNSTNGTFINDVELEYHQPQELNKNDRVRFGIEEYVFS